jgi:hypothetical protein
MLVKKNAEKSRQKDPGRWSRTRRYETIASRDQPPFATPQASSFMPTLTIEYPHSLSAADATARLKALVAAAAQQYQAQLSEFQQDWQGDTLAFTGAALGMKVSGTLESADRLVRLTAELPWAAMIVKGRIQQRVEEEFGRVLG